MTILEESDWVHASCPGDLLSFLDGHQTSYRQLLLFAVACCRSPMVWDMLHDSLSDGRQVVEWAEQHAEGGQAIATFQQKILPYVGDITQGFLGYSQHHLLDRVRSMLEELQRRLIPQAPLADLVRDIVGSPFHPLWVAGGGLMEGHVPKGKGHGVHQRTTSLASWLTFQDGLIPHLARTLYQDQAFDLLPVLADALEEAGCTQPDLLHHLRHQFRCTKCQGTGHGGDHYQDFTIFCNQCDNTGWRPLPLLPNAQHHVKGCWALELFLC